MPHPSSSPDASRQLEQALNIIPYDFPKLCSLGSNAIKASCGNEPRESTLTVHVPNVGPLNVYPNDATWYSARYRDQQLEVHDLAQPQDYLRISDSPDAAREFLAELFDRGRLPTGMNAGSVDTSGEIVAADYARRIYEHLENKKVRGWIEQAIPELLATELYQERRSFHEIRDEFNTSFSKTRAEWLRKELAHWIEGLSERKRPIPRGSDLRSRDHLWLLSELELTEKVGIANALARSAPSFEDLHPTIQMRLADLLFEQRQPWVNIQASKLFSRPFFRVLGTIDFLLLARENLALDMSQQCVCLLQNWLEETLPSHLSLLSEPAQERTIHFETGRTQLLDHVLWGIALLQTADGSLTNFWRNLVSEICEPEYFPVIATGYLRSISGTNQRLAALPALLGAIQERLAYDADYELVKILSGVPGTAQAGSNALDSGIHQIVRAAFEPDHGWMRHYVYDRDRCTLYVLEDQSEDDSGAMHAHIRKVGIGGDQLILYPVSELIARTGRGRDAFAALVRTQE